MQLNFILYKVLIVDWFQFCQYKSLLVHVLFFFASEVKVHKISIRPMFTVRKLYCEIKAGGHQYKASFIIKVKQVKKERQESYQKKEEVRSKLTNYLNHLTHVINCIEYHRDYMYKVETYILKCKLPSSWSSHTQQVFFLFIFNFLLYFRLI